MDRKPRKGQMTVWKKRRCPHFCCVLLVSCNRVFKIVLQRAKEDLWIYEKLTFGELTA